jgi:hypothetical protein
MANQQAPRDGNQVPTLLAVDDTTGFTRPVLTDADGNLLIAIASGGGGDVNGPGSSTDNAIVRWDGTAGTDVQDSTVLIGDTGAISGVLSMTGVAGGSIITGGTGSGDDLTLRSTSNATKGDVFIQDQGGNIIIGGAATASELRFLEPSASGTNYSAFKAVAQTANITYSLPPAVGAAGTFLKDAAGDGVLTWAAPAGGGDVVGPAGATDNAIVRFNGASGTSIQDSIISVGDTGILAPVTSDTGALGSGTLMWSDLFLADGSVINWNNGDLTLTHGANTLTLAGGSLLALGATTATTFNGLAVTANGTNTLNIAAGKSLIVSNSITLAGTDSTVMTFPTTSATIARTDAANTFVGASTASAWVLTSPTITTKISPTSDDGAPLGDTTHNFSDLFLASGAVINYANGDVVLTHTTGILTVGTGDLRVTTAGTNSASVVTVGGAQTLTSKVLSAATITTSLIPTSNDGAPLGDTTHQFSDLFLAEGGVINWDNGDATLTQVGDVVTLAGADLKITTPGNAATSVLTTDGTQTLTNKTLTSPTLTTPSAFTTGGTITLAENSSIALDPAGSADGKYTGITVTATSGYTQAFGDLVYLDPTDSRWEATDANAAAGADGDARGLLGMVVVAGTDGNACTILLNGIIRADAKFPTFTVNNPIYVSETAGLVTQTQPTTTDVVIRFVGSALTADEMYFNPDYIWYTHT